MASFLILRDQKGPLGTNGWIKCMVHVIANLKKSWFFIFTWFCGTVLSVLKIFHVWSILQSEKLKKLIHNFRIARKTIFACSVCTYQ